ncbi:chromosomal replication initiator protein DnaA [Tyzzerella sp. OttesenSCG-928-J15]|nr:chromosomal replication initiator protein DnaA [Tyzzerella sp. OttesenSCG-928-J15]
MSLSASEYWEEALPIMKDLFTEVTFGTFISQLEPLYIKDNVYYLFSEDNFHKVTIEQRHLKNITKTIRAVTEMDIEVKIVSAEDLDNKGNIKKKNGNIINKPSIKSNLIPKYLFENFVKGKSNELAYATALAVGQAPGKTTYNPLFLYGGVGLGKTHLMHSIGNYILEIDPETKVLYCSAETFMNELITSIRNNKNQEFRDKYRDIDVLLIDDIQFLSDKEGTQEEFFHTFNTLYNANKQIVISSDKPPRELKTLEERLKSRFGWGVIVDITLPDFETRTAILEKKAEIDNITIPEGITKFIAKNIVSNIRDLEGALNKVTAYATLSKTEITQELAEIALKDIIEPVGKPVVDVDYIQKVVANFFNISQDDIVGKKRSQNIAHPRQIAMYLSRKLTDLSLPKIGEHFGGRDHSTIIHGCDKIAGLIEKDISLKNTVIEIEKLIVD